MLDTPTLLTGLMVFFARICDVSIGTVRTICTVQGRTLISFSLAVVEIMIWITVVSTVINQVQDKPLLILFYAVGYATGNAVGIVTERKIAFGMLILRVITKDKSHILADRIRSMGQPVTVFQGEGRDGAVYELYIVCRRRDLKKLLPIVRCEDPDAFYITEQARDISKVLRPVCSPVSGWRAVDKRK